ncbi:MAG: polysaccharide biosynthesis protein [Bdellovibrionales bacterium]|nr:polysaccharide biosynthesis protein [Bdellovibrionales bacterium]
MKSAKKLFCSFAFPGTRAQSLARWFGAVALRAHTPLVLLLSIILTSASFYLALALRFDLHVPAERLTFGQFLFPLLLLLLARSVAYVSYKLNRGYWRFVSTTEAVDLLKAHFISSLLFAAALGLFRVEGFPRSIVFVEFMLSLLLSLGCRLGVRLAAERFLAHTMAPGGPQQDVLVLGGGVSGNLLIKALRELPGRPYRPIAVFDDNRRLHGVRIHGVPVVGALSEVEAFIEERARRDGCSIADAAEQRSSIGAVVVAIPLLAPLKMEHLQEVCRRYKVPFTRVQSLEDIVYQANSTLKPKLTIEQILSREEDPQHEDEIRSAICGKRVLVTGAGGSIGSELVRQLLAFEPAKIILVEKSEYNLFSIEREIRDQAPAVEKCFLLSNIANGVRLLRLFKAEQPQVVFHAAAYKHVPLLEMNCYEAFVNNVIGTRNVLHAAEESGAERFVLISTDKAVDPASIMGCTKRVAELMVGHHSLQAPPVEFVTDRPGASVKPPMSTAIVRFGNVINSAGSVIPTFKQQILAGGPLTVTHPEMERYFMSIREAVRLVLTAGTLGDCGEVYLLDMGKPIKIVEVAQKLLSLYGREDIEIVFTGLRPGEKLTEQLYSATETRSNTRFAKVFSVASSSGVRTGADVFAWVQALERHLEELSNQELEVVLKSYVQGRTQLADAAQGVIEAGDAADTPLPQSIIPSTIAK